MDKIILFDGVCSLCNSSVNFLKKNINSKEYNYIPSNSLAGKNLVEKYELGNIPDHTIVLLKNDKKYIKSAAILELISDLPKIYKLLKIIIIVPVSIRDYCYDIISKHRYKLFGKKDNQSCSLIE